MNLYLNSFALFTLSASLVAAIIMWLGRKKYMRWRLIEYLLMYLTWLALIGVPNAMFGGLDQAVAALGLHSGFLIFLCVAAGVFGGLTLLPRLFTAKYNVSEMMVTSISSFMVAVVYVKFVVILFLFMPPPNLD
ncbi:MAG: hypothetical protein R8K46_00590 [Mariprofundaceae bacterium]